VPVLKTEPTLKDIQTYVTTLEKERGFDEEVVLQKCLMLGEEVGELFKALRKEQGMAVDLHSDHFSVAHEIVDVFIMLCAIANRLNVDIEAAFREKEEINKKRTWK
jgi:NTP pyrophosphatase (non-canonical NTP hydrolase)